MKKALRLFVVALALALVATACSSDDLGGRTVTVAVENAHPPYNYINVSTGEGEGFDYAVWTEICDRIGCEPEFVPAAWEGLIIAVGQGTYDVAADGISITAEREEIVDYSDAYMTIVQRIMVRIDESRFTTVEEFTAGDYILGTQPATTNYNLGVEMVGEDRISAYDPFGLAVEALIRGDVDAVIIDDTAGQGFVGVNKESTKLLPEELQSDPLGFIYPQGSDLVGPTNEALQEMIDDGTLDELFKDWFVNWVDPNA